VSDLARQPAIGQGRAGLARVVVGVEVHGDLVRERAEIVQEGAGALSFAQLTVVIATERGS
jgi:hypothetical protein